MDTFCGSLWGWGFTGMMGFGGGFGMIFMILFWVLLILLVVLLVNWLIHQSQSPGETNNNSRALNLLKERYAQGKISKKEFAQKKKDLS